MLSEPALAVAQELFYFRAPDPLVPIVIQDGNQNVEMR
jgi:hypothetical protein